MQWYEIVLIAAAAAFVAGVIVWQIVRRIKGKGGCGCSGCSSCGSCSSCASHKKEQSEKK